MIYGGKDIEAEAEAWAEPGAKFGVCFRSYSVWSREKHAVKGVAHCCQSMLRNVYIRRYLAKELEKSSANALIFETQFQHRFTFFNNYSHCCDQLVDSHRASRTSCAAPSRELARLRASFHTPIMLALVSHKDVRLVLTGHYLDHAIDRV